jgi:hypothetical protein
MQSHEATEWAQKLINDQEIHLEFQNIYGVGHTIDNADNAEKLVVTIQGLLPPPYNRDSRAACQILLEMARLQPIRDA